MTRLYWNYERNTCKEKWGNRPTHCFAELSILAPKKETVLLLVDNESRYTPKVQRLEPENHDDGNSKFEIPPKIQDMKISGVPAVLQLLGWDIFFFFISKSQGRTFHWSEAFGFLEMAKLNGCRCHAFQPGEVIFFGAGTWVTDDSGVPLFLRLDFWDKVGIFSGKNACLSFMRFFFVSHEKP